MVEETHEATEACSVYPPLFYHCQPSDNLSETDSDDTAVDKTMIEWRLQHPTKLHHLSRILKHMQEPNALQIPDITLGAAPELHKSQVEMPRYIGPKNKQAREHDIDNQGANEDEDSDDGEVDENDIITYETIYIATRPQLAQPIYDKIVHHGQSRGNEE
ncbi:hypothetical protein H4R20_007220, partial [Coemansia guatemalensis]